MYMYVCMYVCIYIYIYIYIYRGNMRKQRIASGLELDGTRTYPGVLLQCSNIRQQRYKIQDSLVAGIGGWGYLLNKHYIYIYIYIVMYRDKLLAAGGPPLLEREAGGTPLNLELDETVPLWFLNIYQSIGFRACHPCAGAMLIFSVSFQF